MHILLVDDHPLFRQALAATVSTVRADLRIDQFETAAAVRAALERYDDVALVLLDLKLSDSSGMTALLALRAYFPSVPVAIVSASDDQDTMRAAEACGAAGFIPKAVGIDELVAAIEALIAGYSWFPALERDAGPVATALTSMQTRILHHVQRGLMNKQIAWELSLSEHTVKYHLTGIFRKTGCQTRAQLLAATRELAHSA